MRDARCVLRVTCYVVRVACLPVYLCTCLLESKMRRKASIIILVKFSHCLPKKPHAFFRLPTSRRLRKSENLRGQSLP